MSLAQLENSEASASIGSPCDGSGDAQCTVTLPDNTQDASLFCHPELRVRAKACTAAESCPRGWTCKTDGTERPFCVHPKCSE
jgi:hypothetical protein